MGDMLVETIRGLRNEDLVKLYTSKFKESRSGLHITSGMHRVPSIEEFCVDRRLYEVLSTEIFLRAFHLYADIHSFDLIAGDRQPELLSPQNLTNLQEWKKNPPKDLVNYISSGKSVSLFDKNLKVVTLLWVFLEELIRQGVIIRKDKRSLCEHLLKNFGINYEELPVFVLSACHTPAIVQYLKLTSSKQDYDNLLTTTQLTMTHNSIRHLPLNHLGLLIQPITQSYLDILITKLDPNYMITYKKTAN